MTTIEFSGDTIEVLERSDRAKDGILRFEAFSRGETDQFIEYFMMDEANPYEHSDFIALLGIKPLFGDSEGLEPEAKSTDVARFALNGVWLWQHQQHYDKGAVCGYWYEATPVGQRPIGISPSLIAAVV